MKYLILIDEKDDVAVASEEISANDELYYIKEEKKVILKALNDVPIYHKVSIKDITKDSHIIKYGQKIGLAANDIHIGEHVHTHNVNHY